MENTIISDFSNKLAKECGVNLNSNIVIPASNKAIYLGNLKKGIDGLGKSIDGFIKSIETDKIKHK